MTEALKRPVRSFVMRSGRMTPAQERALQENWARFGIDADGTLLDWSSRFDRAAPVVLEIGFGMGDSLLTMAQQEPEKNFVGIEVHRPGVGRLLNNVAKAGIQNIRVMREDAVTILEQQVEPASLTRIQIYFPDPWHKKRHHKRRLIQPALTTLLASRLVPGGELHLATDWENYAEHMLEVLESSNEFRNAFGPGRFAPEPPNGRPETKFEQRGRRKGHGVWDLLYVRTPG